MPELGPYGFVRGARGNSRPYRDPEVIRCGGRQGWLTLFVRYAPIVL